MQRLAALASTLRIKKDAYGLLIEEDVSARPVTIPRNVSGTVLRLMGARQASFYGSRWPYFALQRSWTLTERALAVEKWPHRLT